MNRHLIAILGLSLLLQFSPSSAQAEVFTLWPFARGGTDPVSVLDGHDLWTEPVIVNGAQSGLGMGLVRQSLRDCFEILSRLYPEAHFRWNTNSLMMESRDEQGRRQRIFLVDLGGTPYGVMRFRIDLPASFEAQLPWPKELPMPTGATPRQSLEFPERDAQFGQFTTSLPPAQALSDLTAQLRANGWTPTTPEGAGSGLSGNGEIFFRAQPLSIMVVNLNETEGGGSLGAVYTRRCGSKP
jgi:hypothetical protein